MYRYSQPTTSKMPNLKSLFNPSTSEKVPASDKKPLNSTTSTTNQKVPLGQQGSGEVQKIPQNVYSFPAAPKDNPSPFSQERLQEAILWSEILGKPASKKRKRRT